MKLTRATRRLASRSRTRQLLVHAQADGTAEAADKPIRRVWRAILDLLRGALPWPEARKKVVQMLSALLPFIRSAIYDRIARIGAWVYGSAARHILATVPKRLLVSAAGGGNGEPPTVAGAAGEDPAPRLRITDLGDILFPPPSEEEVHRIVYSSGWQERLAAATRLAQPETLASIIANGMIQGKDQRQIAQEILPAVQQVRVSARRIARTEALRVAGEMQMQAHEALGDLVVGYQVHSMHDEHVRPWHLQRDGTIYYKSPGPGQKGLPQMPRPPEEAPDPNERPPGTPQMAWNCRCFLTPILRS